MSSADRAVHRRAVSGPPNRNAAGDSGVTLLETVVAMSVMSAVLAIFTTSIIGIYRSTNHIEAALTAQSQIHTVFERLDSEVRYATSISVEGTVSGTGDWYVEYLSTHTGAPVCAQLRLTAAGLLQQRRWEEGAPPQGFTTLASGITGTHPFTRLASDIDGYDFERLLVSVSATGGTGAPARRIDVAFTALNSASSTADETVCGDGRAAA